MQVAPTNATYHSIIDVNSNSRSTHLENMGQSPGGLGPVDHPVSFVSEAGHTSFLVTKRVTLLFDPRPD